MKLSVGDKVRAYFYPPKTTHSFVEGIIDRNEINTFRGPGFSLQVTREVVLGHEITTPRSLPYIIAYEKEDDFEGRIEVLQPTGQLPSEPVIEAVSGTGANHATKAQPDEIAEELSPVLETQVEAEIQSEPQKRGWRRLFNRAA
jgi:hypothetical protein